MKTLLKFIPFYAVASWVYVYGLFAGHINLEGSAAGFTMIAAIIIGLFATISTFTSIFSHLAELGSLRSCIENVANAEEYLKEIKENIKIVTDTTKDLDDSVVAKANVEHPIVSAMREVSAAQKDLRKYKNNLASYRSDIAARKVGPFGWVVNMYGEE